MQGRHEYQPELFSQIDIEALIPKNHLLRKIDRVLDLSFLREETARFYSEGVGRPSIDPEIFLRMVILGHLYNIESDRQLCEEIGFNLSYRWFCRLSMKDSVPDHSSMTKVRDRLGEETFRKIFLKVVEQCQKAGLVKGERLMADGAMIQANASLYTMEEKNKDQTNDDNLSGGIKQRESKDGLSTNDLRRNSISGRRISNETHYSRTDPDATLAGKQGEWKSLRFKTHHIADFDSRVILDCFVTTGRVSEVTKFIERFKHVENELKLKVGEVIADRGYGSGENLEYLLKERKINTNIPLWSTRVGQSFFKEKDFAYDYEKKEMHCPAGHKMKRIKNDAKSATYIMGISTCRVCPHYMTCLSEVARKQVSRGKRVRVCLYQDIYDHVLSQEKTTEFVAKLRERMWRMEGLFAEGKSRHGLRHARYRGRWKVQTQVYLISTVQNLKRLANAVLGDLIASFANWSRNNLITIFSEELPSKNIFLT
jgi:transposase